MAHLEDHLGAVDVTLTSDDRARLDAAAEPERAIVPYYTGKMVDFNPPQFRW
jgi:hypothetical protein